MRARETAGLQTGQELLTINVTTLGAPLGLSIGAAALEERMTTGETRILVLAAKVLATTPVLRPLRLRLDIRRLEVSRNQRLGAKGQQVSRLILSRMRTTMPFQTEQTEGTLQLDVAT